MWISKSHRHGYPHFFYIDDKPAAGARLDVAFDLGGESIRQFVNYAFTSDVEALQPGQTQATSPG